MADDVPLAFYQPAGLFLKPEARISIEVKLPEIRAGGTTVSNWEVMEKLKALSKPEEFQSLRVARYSRERIEFEGEFESLRPMRKVVLLLNGKSMKLSGFTELLKIKAKQLEAPHPTKTEWEEFFTEKGVELFDEAKPGERPDTIRVKGLPVQWFVSKTSDGEPCPRVLTLAFQKFGKVRQVGLHNPSSSLPSFQSQTGSFSSFGPGAGARTLHFEAYIQYEKYFSFCCAMRGLKGMQILRLEEGGREGLARITLDFDKSGFLSDRNVRKRKHVQERKQREIEEAEMERAKERREQECKEQETLRQLEEEKARRRAIRREERRRRKQEKADLAAKLKEIAVRRREEAQQLLGVLLAGTAEAKYQEEQEEERCKELARARKREEAKRKEQMEAEATRKKELVKKVQELEQRKLEIQRELLLRSLASGGGTQLKSAVVVPPSDTH